MPKTDELRLQACGHILDRYRLNTRFYISEKIADLGLTTVPIIDDNFFLQNNTTVDNLINMAIGESRLAKTKREGLVFRSTEETIDVDIGRLSFKCINPEFLIKYNE